MTVRELKEKLNQLVNQDAKVQFFEASKDRFFDLDHLDAGVIKGVYVVVLGEMTMHQKVKLANTPFTRPKSQEPNFDELFSKLFGGTRK